MVRRTIPIQSPLNAEFEKFVHETLQKWHVPGMAIAVVDGEHTWAEVFTNFYQLSCIAFH